MAGLRLPDGLAKLLKSRCLPDVPLDYTKGTFYSLSGYDAQSQGSRMYMLSPPLVRPGMSKINPRCLWLC